MLPKMSSYADSNQLFNSELCTVHKLYLHLQVTSEGGGGVVSARDFVYGCKTMVSGKKMVIGGLSVVVEEQPEVKGFVRAQHGPGCQIIEDTGDADKYVFNFKYNTIKVQI